MVHCSPSGIGQVVEHSLKVLKVLGSNPGQGSKYDKFLTDEKYSVKTVIPG